MAVPHDSSGADYRRLSIGQKQARHRERMREPAVVCPVCETQTTAAELLTHLDGRCSGPREPNPHASWVSWRQALAMGVPRATMNKWVRSGAVRVRGELQAREYLLRDLVMRLAMCRQRRQFTKVNRDGADAGIAG